MEDGACVEFACYVLQSDGRMMAIESWLVPIGAPESEDADFIRRFKEGEDNTLRFGRESRAIRARLQAVPGVCTNYFTSDDPAAFHIPIDARIVRKFERFELQ